jgi:hypothetical protein
MTVGVWLKPGATFTIPNTLTIRAIRSGVGVNAGRPYMDKLVESGYVQRSDGMLELTSAGGVARTGGSGDQARRAHRPGPHRQVMPAVGSVAFR